jgi:acylphosphatase
MGSMAERRRWIVRGRVQGVGFRWFVAREATRLGVGGFVRNLHDGSVEVVSQGTDEQLDALGAALSRGPQMARVDAVDTLHVPVELEVPPTFAIQ